MFSTLLLTFTFILLPILTSSHPQTQLTPTEEQEPLPLFADPPIRLSCATTPSKITWDVNPRHTPLIAHKICTFWKYDFGPKINYTIDHEVYIDGHHDNIVAMYPPEKFSDKFAYKIYVAPTEYDERIVAGAVGYQIESPIEGYGCEEAMVEAWKSCYSNKGRGGALQVGYMTFSLMAKN